MVKRPEREIKEYWATNTDISVSICCLTFNHENYIRQTLDGFLMQKTSFPFKILIHDDASTDNTVNILREYEKEYPNLFDILVQQKNQRSIYKTGIGIRFNYPRAKGKYIAVCEGDDYWLDPLKLQKQVDFLENNLDYNLVGHRAKDSYNVIRGIFEKDSFGFDDVYFRNLRIPTASFVFRNNIEFPDWSMKVYGGDRATIFLNAQKGKLKILPFIGSHYRIHENGVEQFYKKDKFKMPIRNINVEIVYYNLIKEFKKSNVLYKKIIKNHFYMIIQSILRFKPRYFIMGVSSLFKFLMFKKVKVEV